MSSLDKVYSIAVDIKNVEGKYSSYAKFFDDDRDTSIIKIKLLNNNYPIDLEGCTVEAEFILANNTYHDETCKIINTSEGIVELQLCQKCLVKGENIVRLSILKDNEIANTPIITYEVRKGLYSDNPNFNDDPLTPILSQMLLDVKVTKVNQIELQERYEKSLPKIEGKIKEVESLINRVDTVIASGTQDLEVKEARVDKNGKSYAKLGDRLDEVDSQLAQKANEIFNNQEDFIETIKRNYKPKNMHFFVNNIEEKIFSIKNIIDNDYAIQYSTRQRSLNSELDGYITIGEGRYGRIQKQTVITHRLPADSLTGEWDKTYPPSYYAKSVGATMTKTFTGERIDFFHFADNRGGIWEFVLDGDKENAVTYSVWSEVAGAKGPFVLFDNLENKQHTLVATFKGDDPNHPPSSGAGTSRGWCYYNDGENNLNSFYIYTYHDNVTSITTPLYGSSNKEFAISSRKKGTTHPFHFCPYHDVITSFQIEPPKIKIDGEEKELSTGDFFKNVSEIKIIQHINAKNPESSEILAEIFTTTTFKDDGTITVDGKYEAKTDLDIDSAYGIMWMVDANFNTKICSSINKTYLTSDTQMGTNLYLTDESDKTTSFISVSKDFPDICTAVTFNNPKSTLRSGMDKKVDKCTWIEYRAGGILTKLYQQVYGKTSIDVGEVFRFSGTFIVGKVENIYNLI